MHPADVDTLRERVNSLSNKITAHKNSLEKCRQRFAVYSDIAKTYCEISKDDYISNLVEEERKRQEQIKKKKQHKKL